MKKTIFSVIFFCFTCLSLFAQEERVIRAHALKHFPPQYVLDENGKPSGFAIDIIEEVAKIADMKVEYILFDDWSSSNKAFFEDGVGDIVPSSGITPERQAKAIFSTPIETIHIRMFKRSNSIHVNNKNDIKDKKVAVVIDNTGHTIMKDHPKELLEVFDTKDEAFSALLSGKVDALIYPDLPIMSMIQKAGANDHIVPFGAPLLEVKRGIRINKNDPALAAKLDGALRELLNSHKYLEIYKKWHDYTPSYRNLKHISSASEPDYPPFSIMAQDRSADGFAIELMRAALQAMGKEPSFKVAEWSIIKDELARGEIDALPLVGRTPERELLYDFTIPYMQLFGTIVVRKDNNDIKNAQDLKDREIIVMKGDNAEEFLRREQISDNLILTPTFEKAFELLSQGEGDAVVVQQLVARGLLGKTGTENLKMIDTPLLGFRQDFCFAVQKGNWELLSILNEGLAVVKADGTYEKLHRKWLPFLYEEQISTKLFYSLLALLAFMFVALVAIWQWKRILSYEVKTKTKELQDMNKTLSTRVEDEVQRRVEQESLLIQQSKMAAMGEMIGAIAHQWKQPINIISLAAQNTLDMIEYDEIDIERLRSDGNSIISQVEFMSQTINDFRNFFSPSKQAINFDAKEAVEHIVRILSASLKRRLIEVEIAKSGDCSVLGYPNEFKQAVFNIINNAKDVLEERKIEFPKINISFERDENMQIIRIGDNGGGIEQALLPSKIFEPYITTKGEKGTGIGLQICKMIVEKNMGGSLEAKNIEKGAEFIIKLPILQTAKG